MAERRGKPLPYAVKVDPDDALELVKSGASLLALDMPQHSFLGCDLHLLSVGPLFKGLKMIPPGPHFIYYSPSSHHGPNLPFITGFFIHPNPGDVLVRRWDPLSETLVQLSDADEEARYQAAVRNLDMDRHLGAYDLHHYHTWKRLTAHITPQVIERLEPVGANISVMHEGDFADRLPQTPAERHMHQHLVERREALSSRTAPASSLCQGTGDNVHGLPASQDAMGFNDDRNGESQRIRTHIGDAEDTNMDTDHSISTDANASAQRGARHGTSVSEASSGGSTSDGGGKKPSGRCFYTRFPHLVKQQGISASALTMLNVDKSLELEGLLEQEYKGSEESFLGELEFSFIAFLMGQSLESFAQWKAIVCLMLSCDEAPLSRHTQLFVKFLDIVCFQLHVGLKTGGESGWDNLCMDDSWFSEDNFLRSRVREFYEVVTEANPVDGDLLKQTRRLKEILESALGWSLDNRKEDTAADEDDEYAPVVVSDTELSSLYGDT